MHMSMRITYCRLQGGRLRSGGRRQVCTQEACRQGQVAGQAGGRPAKPGNPDFPVSGIGKSENGKSGSPGFGDRDTETGKSGVPGFGI